MLKQLLRDDNGQDLIEYALLAALIALTGVLVLRLLPGVVGSAYGRWDSGVQSKWEPPDPV
jgi:Flp pilus assembly pilin Flp